MVEISPLDLVASRDAAPEGTALDSKRESLFEEGDIQEVLYRNHAPPLHKVSRIFPDNWWDSKIIEIAKNSTHDHKRTEETKMYEFSPLLHQHANQGKDILKAYSQKSPQRPITPQNNVVSVENKKTVMSFLPGSITGKTSLFQYVENEEWDLAALWAEAFAEETKTWVVIRGNAITTTTLDSSQAIQNVTFLRLPLHEALIRKAPYTVIRSLVNVNPDATKETDENGRLPLHLAFYYGADLDCVMDLITVFSAALDIPDRGGMKPLDLVPESTLLELLAKGFERCKPVEEAEDLSSTLRNKKDLSFIIAQEEKKKRLQALISHQLEETVQVTEVNSMSSSNQSREELLEKGSDFLTSCAKETATAREVFVPGVVEPETVPQKEDSKNESIEEKKLRAFSIPTDVSERMSVIRSKISQANGELLSGEPVVAHGKLSSGIQQQLDCETDSVEKKDTEKQHDKREEAERWKADKALPLEPNLMVTTGVDHNLMLHYIEKISAALLKTDLSEIARLQKENRLLEDELRSALHKLKKDRENSGADLNINCCAFSSKVLQEGMEPSLQDQHPKHGTDSEKCIDNDLVLCYAEKIASAISRTENKEIERLQDENRLIKVMWKELESTTETFENDCYTLHRDFLEKIKHLRMMPPEHIENKIPSPIAVSDEGQQGEESFPLYEEISDLSRKTNNDLIYQVVTEEAGECFTVEMDYTISTETKELPQQILISEEREGFLAVDLKGSDGLDAAFAHQIQKEVKDVKNTMADNGVIKQDNVLPFCCMMTFF